MSFLKETPQSISVDVLGNWIDTEALREVDTAYCNTIERKFLLEIFSLSFFVTEGVQSSKNCIRWIILRNLQVRYLIADCDYLTNRMAEKQFVNTTFIESLVTISKDLSTAQMNALIDFTNSCSRLKSLILRNVLAPTNYVVMSLNSEIFSQLTYLEFPECVEESTNVITHLSLHCHSLRTLKIHTHSCISNAPLVELLKQNSCLEVIYIHCLDDDCPDNFLSSLSTHCPNIREVEMELYYLFPVHVLIQFIQSAHYLTNLKLTGSILDEEIEYERHETVSNEFIKQKESSIRPGASSYYQLLDHTATPSTATLVSQEMKTSGITEVLVSFKCMIFTHTNYSQDHIYFFEQINGFTHVVLYDLHTDEASQLIQCIFDFNPECKIFHHTKMEAHAIL